MKIALAALTAALALAAGPLRAQGASPAPVPRRFLIDSHQHFIDSPDYFDRLARVYAYQVLVLEELERHGVRVLFTDAPALDDDPQARLLTQVQGVIAEYERAKIAERNRRGRLYRARAGEPVSWNVPYVYRRLPRTAAAPARPSWLRPTRLGPGAGSAARSPASCSAARTTGCRAAARPALRCRSTTTTST